MDYRFDPTHITFRARQMRRYRDRAEAKLGKPSTPMEIRLDDERGSV